MNPGVVQWMALEEHDNSFFADKSLANKKTIYTTWS